MFQFDESDPRFLIVYSGEDHATPDDYRALHERWIARLMRDERFGVILVTEDHEHDHDEDDDEHRQQEAEVTRIINDFRRDYRDRTAQINLGYARVVPEIWLEKYYANDMAAIQQAIDGIDRLAQYNWGIPGSGFISVDEAKAWLLEQVDRQPSSEPPAPVVEIVNKRVGLFYGSSTGLTEYVADEIADAWAKAGMEPLVPINVGTLTSLGQLLEYDDLILGIPTWNIGQLQDDWDILFPQLDTLDFNGKTVALFGVGDQYGYPDNFLDAVGILGKRLVERGAELVGYWYDDAYEFEESVAFVDGKFMGLGIDETNQSRETSGRIEQWIAQIITEFALQPQAAS